MSDELIPLEHDDDGDDEVPASERPLDWTRLVLVVAAVVAAVSLAVSARAEVGQQRDTERLRCLQEAQLLAFTLGVRGDPREAVGEHLASCGVEVPTLE